ncbi:hypothetical protein AB0F81_26060 [Actinoplanes sp. NPDC024001]|uniref:hypothetical protein n=1 Tax=Actinoplanes sp. NPDC024001 TaxID=3154598 RepID=UPI0033EA960B
MNPAAWQGPPRDVLGRPVPIQRFVARTGRAVVALQEVVAFPEGCLLMLLIAARRGSLEEPAWVRLHDETGLRFGVRFPDGSRATTAGNAFPGWAPATDRPAPPMLVEGDGGASSDDRFYRGDQQLWLWPLPPPGPFEFLVEWPGMDLGVAATTLDGDAIARAAKLAEPYWP